MVPKPNRPCAASAGRRSAIVECGTRGTVVAPQHPSTLAPALSLAPLLLPGALALALSLAPLLLPSALTLALSLAPLLLPSALALALSLAPLLLPGAVKDNAESGLTGVEHHPFAVWAPILHRPHVARTILHTTPCRCTYHTPA